MQLEEIRIILADALPLRVPQFEPETPPKERVRLLEDYLMGSAFQRGALIETRHWLRLLEGQLGEQIDELDGWEPFLQLRSSKGASKSDILEAKGRANPGLFAALGECRRLRGSVDDQIDRFAFEDEKVISRCYSMISGA
jgi:hypothetical protein